MRLLICYIKRLIAKSKYLNYVLGTFCSGYLVLQSFTGYRGSHIYKHHPHLGNEILDPDYKGLIQNNLYGNWLGEKQVMQYLRTLYYPINTFRYLKYLAQYKMFSCDENSIERLVRLVYLFILAAISIRLNVWHLVILYWFIPLITTASWTGSLVELAEHYPLMETAPKVDIYLTRNRICNPCINFFVGKHWDGYHLIHHLFPKIPSWNYKKSHQILMEDSLYFSLNQDDGWLAVLRGMIPSNADSHGNVTTRHQ
jgi:fatty acid desaturase